MAKPALKTDIEPPVGGSSSRTSVSDRREGVHLLYSDQSLRIPHRFSHVVSDSENAQLHTVFESDRAILEVSGGDMLG